LFYHVYKDASSNRLVPPAFLVVFLMRTGLTTRPQTFSMQPHTAAYLNETTIIKNTRERG
jgi:hypothetical protein